MLIERPASGASEISSVEPDTRARGWGRPTLWFTLGALLAGLGGWIVLRPTESPAPVVRLSIEVAPEHGARDLAIAPDASAIAYAGQVGDRPRLVLRALDAYGASPVAGTDGASQPFFSPDGGRIGFLADESVRALTRDDGRIVTLGQAPVGTAGAAWRADGSLILASPVTGGLLHLRADGLRAELTRPDPDRDELSHGWPVVSADGTHVIFTVARRGRASRVAVLSLDGDGAGAWTHLYPGLGRAQLLGDDILIYQLDADLMALSIDPDTLEAGGSPMTVLPGVAGSPTDHGGLGTSRFAVAVDGTLIYQPSQAGDGDTRLVWVERDGSVSPISDRRGRHRHPRLSPDGRRIAVTVGDGLLGGDIWIHDVETDTRTRATEAGSDNRAPVWAPDGRALAFASNRAGPQTIFRRAADLAGGAVPLTDGGDAQNPASWSPVGRILTFYRVGERPDRDIWALGPDGHAVALLATAHNERSPMLSPDGRWLAYVSDETGRDGVHVRAHPDVAAGPVASFDGAVEPVWSRDASQLFVWRGDRLMVSEVGGGSGAETFSDPRTLFERRFVRDPGSNLPNYDVGADGRFVMLAPADPPTTIRVITGWGGDVRRHLTAQP